MQITDPSLHRN